MFFFCFKRVICSLHPSNTDLLEWAPLILVFSFWRDNSSKISSNINMRSQWMYCQLCEDPHWSRHTFYLKVFHVCSSCNSLMFKQRSHAKWLAAKRTWVQSHPAKAAQSLSDHQFQSHLFPIVFLTSDIRMGPCHIVIGNLSFYNCAVSVHLDRNKNKS